jgi:CBS domain-containing protein
MTIVAQLLQAKGSDIWSVTRDTLVYDAIKLMAEKGVGALLVLQEERLVGIVSERDYARKVILREKSSKDTPVREIMTERVFYVRPEQSIEECMAIMTDRHIRHLPVLDGEQLVGIISIGDVVKATISNQEFLIQQLENYITSS